SAEPEPRHRSGEAKEPEPIEAIRGRTVCIVSGVGNPAAFRKTVESLGAEVVAEKTFPDHHAYTREDVVAMAAWATSMPKETVVVTTQKDFVKLRVRDLNGRPVRALRVGLKILSGEGEFRTAVNGVI